MSIASIALLRTQLQSSVFLRVNSILVEQRVQLDVCLLKFDFAIGLIEIVRISSTTNAPNFENRECAMQLLKLRYLISVAYENPFAICM